MRLLRDDRRWEELKTKAIQFYDAYSKGGRLLIAISREITTSKDDGAKETAEHITIVDLIRNDIGMIANHVRVRRFRFIDTLVTSEKTLLQVSSEVCGLMRGDFRKSLGTLLFKMLPAGSITGAPKKKTVEIITDIEGYDRGYYTGVFGCYDGKNLESAVMIRFIEKLDSGDLYFKSGGGLTIYSDPKSEYQELVDKVYVPFSRNNKS